jgi:hypothetical protein
MIAITMLIYAVSLKLQLPARVTIHNQCPNTKLASPIYFGDGVVCPRLSNQQLDIGTAVRACFEINTTQDVSKGALLFKLQKYSNEQYNTDTSTTDTDKNVAKCVYMLVAWSMWYSILSTHVTLIEHTNEFTWDEDKLNKLYDKNCDWLKEYYDTLSDTWLIDYNVIFKTTLEVKFLRGNPEVSISISEGKDDYAIKPFCINLER